MICKKLGWVAFQSLLQFSSLLPNSDSGQIHIWTTVWDKKKEKKGKNQADNPLNKSTIHTSNSLNWAKSIWIKENKDRDIPPNKGCESTWIGISKCLNIIPAQKAESTIPFLN